MWEFLAAAVRDHRCATNSLKHSYATKPQELGCRAVYSNCYLQADQADHVEIQPRKGLSTASNGLVRTDNFRILDAKSLAIWRNRGAPFDYCG